MSITRKRATAKTVLFPGFDAAYAETERRIAQDPRLTPRKKNTKADRRRMSAETLAAYGDQRERTRLNIETRPEPMDRPLSARFPMHVPMPVAVKTIGYTVVADRCNEPCYRWYFTKEVSPDAVRSAVRHGEEAKAAGRDPTSLLGRLHRQGRGVRADDVEALFKVLDALPRSVRNESGQKRALRVTHD